MSFWPTFGQQPSPGDEYVISENKNHPANLICELCALFYDQNWVTGTGGGMSIRHNNLVYIAPSGVQKEVSKGIDK